MLKSDDSERATDSIGVDLEMVPAIAEKKYNQHNLLSKHNHSIKEGLTLASYTRTIKVL